jgi:hypothetical protein
MSYKKVFFSTYAVIAAILCLIAVLWVAAELRSKYETHLAEQRERDAKQEVENLKNCMDLSGPVIGPKENDLRMKLAAAAGVGNDENTAGIHDLEQKVRADNDWLEQHTQSDIYDDGRGDHYDGMTNENYAACQARFAPELKQVQAKQAEQEGEEAKEVQRIPARNTEASRLASIDYFQSRGITFICGGEDDPSSCKYGQLTVTEPKDTQFQPSKKQLACALAEAKFQYNLFDAVVVNVKENTGAKHRYLYVVPANPSWPQDFIAPAGCQ